MSEATNRLAAAVTANTEASQALMAKLAGALADNGDAAANAASDALDASTAAMNAVINPPAPETPAPVPEAEG